MKFKPGDLLWLDEDHPYNKLWNLGGLAEFVAYKQGFGITGNKRTVRVQCLNGGLYHGQIVLVYSSGCKLLS